EAGRTGSGANCRERPTSGLRPALARLRGLPCRGLPLRLGTRGALLSADAPTLLRRRGVDLLPPARTRLLAPAGHLVDRGPGTPRGLVGLHAPLSVALFDVLRLSLLFVRVAGLVTSGHAASSIDPSLTAPVAGGRHPPEAGDARSASQGMRTAPRLPAGRGPPARPPAVLTPDRCVAVPRDFCDRDRRTTFLSTVLPAPRAASRGPLGFPSPLPKEEAWTPSTI